MFNKPSLIAFTLIAQILPSVCYAQELEEAQLTEGDFFNEFPVILTGTRLKQSKKQFSYRNHGYRQRHD